MIEVIYVAIAVLIFFAQVRNGFLTALLTAVFWPVAIAGLTLITIFGLIYHTVKR